MNPKLPLVFKHGGDGNWRSRYRDEKGRIRTAKFREGYHQPGANGEQPPINESGSFVAIPKPIRDTLTPQQPQPEAEPAQVEATIEPTPQTEPQPENSPQTEAPQPPQSEEPQQSEPAPAEAFPEYCEDAMRGASESTTEPLELPQADTFEDPVAPGESKESDLPVIEMAVDTFLQLGEMLGGPKAPKSATMGAISTETLRDMMVKNGKAAFPGMDIEMGPKTSLGLCAIGYLGLCYSQEEFRKNTAPWYLRARAKFAGWWVNRKQRKAAAKQAAQEIKEQQKEESNDA